MEHPTTTRLVTLAGVGVLGLATSAFSGSPASGAPPAAGPTPPAAVQHSTMSQPEITAKMGKLRADARAARRDPGIKALQGALARELAATQAAKNQKVALALQQALGGLAKPVPVRPTVPKINLVVQSPPLSPGDRILIFGEGFGGSEDGPPTPPEGGSVRLIGYFPPEAHLDLRIVRWAPASILAELPPVSGVPDQEGIHIQVRRSPTWSNQVESSFRATRVFVMLTKADVPVLVCHDADLASNGCNPPYTKHGGGTFSAVHAYTDGECGYDQVRVSLGNGYTLDHTYLDATYSYIGGTISGPMPAPAVGASLAGFPQGASRADLTINWCFDGLGGIDYGLIVYAIGPKGLPYR